MKKIDTPKELLHFMSKEIKYGYLTKNGKLNNQENQMDWYEQYILQSKDEILNNRYGNCFDQVELERDWFKKHNYEYKTIYEMVLLDYKNNYPTHSFLVYKDDNKWNWFENADLINRGIHTFNTLEDLIEYQYNKYLELLKTFNITEEEKEKIIMVEFDKPKDNISAKEYLNHVLSSKIIRGEIN